MKNKREIEEILLNEEISLPESLSAENIEKLINEKGAIASPKRIHAFPTKSVTKWASAAAVLVVLIGVVAVIGMNGINSLQKQEMNDVQQQEIIDAAVNQNNTNEENVNENQNQNENDNNKSSDYTSLHKTVLEYYKDIYNNTVYAQDDSDGILGGIFDSILGDFAVKEEAMNSTLSSSAPATGTTSESATGTTQHTTTNTQVQGVDEADIVKTDGEYIYYLVNNTIRIVRCSDPENMVILGAIELTENVDYNLYPVEMYLYDNSLVVVLRENSEYQPVSYSNSYGAVCDCLCIALKTDTVIKCYDISDKENPRETFSHKITGEYVSSRVTDGKLITVAQFNIPYNSVKAEDFSGACEVVKDVCVPEYSVGNGEMQKIPADRIEVFDEKSPTCYTVTSILNLNDMSQEPKMNALLGGGNELYCTKEEIFVAEQIYSTWTHDETLVATDSLGNKFDIATRIHKMKITDDGVDYISSVTVGGMCINQFSMDKNGDYFRIATNGWNYNGSNQKTMVYVIDKDMKIVGFLDNIAPSEQMKSARFMGNVLYLVTFMQTDPLFIIDLSVPEKPEIKGELKIPGFSTYLHPAGDGLLIGVGEGGTMTGTDGTAKISLFDVSDPYNLKELDNYTTSEMASFTGNHKEFVVIDDDTYGVTLVNYMQTDMFVVFSITDGGIVIDNTYLSKPRATYGNTRGIVIDDYVFVVSSSGILAYEFGQDYYIDELSF